MTRQGARFDAEAIRSAILESVPAEFATHGSPPEPRFLYVPARHMQALSPDHSLVVGIRGAGKSLWWSALQSEAHRRVVQSFLPKLRLDTASSINAGFGEASKPDDYPDKHVLKSLITQKRSPATIWRTVMAWHVWGKETSALKRADWGERVKWVEQNPEPVARRFAEADKALAASRQVHMVLFDALDRAADEWAVLRQLLRGLLQVLLEFRAYRGLRAKAFVRPDMLDDSTVINFADASKVTASRVDLRWERVDLYGLLWQRIGNASDGGSALREGTAELDVEPWREKDKIWHVPERLRDAEELQRRVFSAIAGEWMGTDRRRGIPYTWLASHLADGNDQVSPRSFLSAVRTATEATPSHGGSLALHYEAIKKGVQEASRIRVDEVAEDFPWVPVIMEPLEGLVIPCDFEEIRSRWESADTLNHVWPSAKHGGLAPKHLDQGLDGLREDMVKLALFSEMQDGRINMPDVYRVGFRLGRKGGVKPIR